MSSSPGVAVSSRMSGRLSNVGMVINSIYVYKKVFW